MTTPRNYKVATIPGDGIGIDVVDATLQVLQALQDTRKTFTLDIEKFDWSSKIYLDSGTYIPESAWPKLKACDAILFGAVGSPDVPDDISLWKLILPLRKRLNQYINLRPIRVLPGLSSPLKSCASEQLDWIIVRENSEGEYAGQGGVSHEDTQNTIANEVAVFTRTAIERTMRFAFEIADSRPRKKLTMVTKSNAQRFGLVLWDKIFYEVAKDYPQVETDKMLVDAMTVRMVLKPQSLDTVVATNLHGDILSDLAAALAGSIGIAPSSNLDPTRKFPSMFEPIHGSAPDITGKGIANPLATFWSAAEMLRWLGEEAAADHLMQAIEETTQSDVRTPDLQGSATTADVTYRLNNPALFIHDAFIDGKWTPRERKFDVYEPSSATVLGRVSDCTLDDFQQAILSAFNAQNTYYESTTATQRGSLLRKWNDLILANADDLAIILSLENGKTLPEARGEVLYAASFISWFAEEATRSYGASIPSSTPHTTLTTVREPVGVCSIITPWNFPAAMITRKIGPALAAGCAVVIKPPSETPYSCLALTKLAIEAGLPPKTIQVCPTKDRQAATELITSPLISKISFTGSTGVGKRFAQLAAGTLKKVSLELGGNAPFIVFDDADVDLAVEGAMFCKYRCSGQTCVCANRLYVQKGIVTTFTAKLTEKVRSLRMGSGLDPSSTQGPLVNKAAVGKVHDHVQDALSRGAKIEIGGKAPDEGGGFFFEPTVLSGVTQDMMISKDETFGPLAPIFEFETEQDAIRLANDTEFGLAGYFFSKDIGRIMRVARKLKVGMVGVNTGKISAAEAPFGGVKESGYGKEGSLYGLAEYQNIKSITIGNLDK